jgi:hypothetical protein
MPSCAPSTLSVARAGDLLARNVARISEWDAAGYAVRDRDQFRYVIEEVTLERSGTQAAALVCIADGSDLIKPGAGPGGADVIIALAAARAGNDTSGALTSPQVWLGRYPGPRKVGGSYGLEPTRRTGAHAKTSSSIGPSTSNTLPTPFATSPQDESSARRPSSSDPHETVTGRSGAPTAMATSAWRGFGSQGAPRPSAAPPGLTIDQCRQVSPRRWARSEPEEGAGPPRSRLSATRGVAAVNGIAGHGAVVAPALRPPSRWYRR